jgi:hypothetical protein
MRKLRHWAASHYNPEENLKCAQELGDSSDSICFAFARRPSCLRPGGAERRIYRREQTGSDASTSAFAIRFFIRRATSASCRAVEPFSDSNRCRTENLKMALDCACLYGVGSQWS